MGKQPISKKLLDVLTAFIRAMARRDALVLIDDLDTHTLRTNWLQGISPKYAQILDGPISVITEVGWNGNLVLKKDGCDQIFHVWTADELERYAQEAIGGDEIDAIAEEVAECLMADRQCPDQEVVGGLEPENQDEVYATQIGETCECDGCHICSEGCNNCKGMCHARRCRCPVCA